MVPGRLHAPDQRRRLGDAEQMRDLLDLRFVQVGAPGCPVEAEIRQAVDRIALRPPRFERSFEFFPAYRIFLEVPVDIFVRRITLLSFSRM